MSRLIAVPRPPPLKASSKTSLIRRVEAQAAAIAGRSVSKGRALEKFQKEILDDMDASDLRRKTARHASVG